MSGTLTRRGLLGAAAATTVTAGAVGSGETAAATGGHGHHPASRHEFVVHDATVLSMDPAVGDLTRGDVHVRDGRIVAVGRGLRARGERIDGRGTVVMPGLVDTHWHLWTSLYRSLSSTSPANAYFALNLRNGAKCLPSDLYAGARMGLADAVSTGITTVHDWSHNLRSPAHADANLRAHAEVGLRGRFSYGSPQGLPVTERIDLADLARVKREWFDAGRLPLMHLGLAGRPPGQSPESVFRPEYDTARGLGLPVAYHANSTVAQGALQMIRRLSEQRMLTPATQPDPRPVHDGRRARRGARQRRLDRLEPVVGACSSGTASRR
ncbi:hypothetical protein GCM10025868_22460 [Angustibacter aerolatus]|uniref:Amidohydrolase-related domain-containing protein n=1 Tax=Angustibacter aerolatus TaxID=1162965 RepID=A0ABQ6JFM4_9ACTN|nr:amidohydrolase family protein [Angustibacter aerolatus]GMA86996.1 hypothetical protein GCM10025868_22460 [Angustibacter aerolatus]